MEFAGCSLDNLFVTLLDCVEFVMMRSNFVKVLAGYFCCNFRDCWSCRCVVCVGRQDLCVGAGCGGVAVAGDGASVASGVAFVLRVASALSFVLST